MKITAFQGVLLSSLIDRYQCHLETLVPIYKTARRHTPSKPKSAMLKVIFLKYNLQTLFPYKLATKFKTNLFYFSCHGGVEMSLLTLLHQMTTVLTPDNR